MSHNCHSWSDLDDLLSLPPDDSRLDHLGECPACRSLLASYRRFLEPGDVFAGTDGEAARRRLASCLRREIGGTAPFARDRGADPLPRSPRRFRFSRIGVAGIAAAVLLVALAAPRLMERRGDAPVSGVLRDSGSKAYFSVESTEEPGGGLSLSWSPFEGAHEYRIVVYGADLKERARFEAGGQTAFDLSGDRRRLLTDERPLLWRVVALHGGDEIGRSEIRVLLGD